MNPPDQSEGESREWADRVAAFALRAIRKVFGAAERRLPGEPGPLLDNPQFGCSSRCTAMHVVPGCPIHDSKVKP